MPKQPTAPLRVDVQHTRITKRALRRRGVSIHVVVTPLKVTRAHFVGLDGDYLINLAARLDRRQRGRAVRRFLRHVARAEATGDWRALPSGRR